MRHKGYHCLREENKTRNLYYFVNIHRFFKILSILSLLVIRVFNKKNLLNGGKLSLYDTTYMIDPTQLVDMKFYIAF